METRIDLFASPPFAARVFFIVVLALGCSDGTDEDAERERRVDDLVSQMTLEEKIAQMAGDSGIFLPEGERLWNAPGVEGASGPGPYVGWLNFDPTIEFFFDQVLSFNSVTFYFDASYAGGVTPPTSVNIEGANFAVPTPPGSASSMRGSMRRTATADAPQGPSADDAERRARLIGSGARGLL